MDKIIELAKKIKVLSEQGVGGEKINATQKLERIMKQHGLSIEDIEGEKTDFVHFKVSKEQNSLFLQVVSTVIGSSIKRYTNSAHKGKFILKTTAADAVEIQMKFDFYWDLYKKELDIFLYAFIVKNNIFDPTADKLQGDKLSDDEFNRQLRVRQMADNIKKGEFLRQINQ